MENSLYCVWRRSDGYVSVSAGHMPPPPDSGQLRFTFEKLFVADWPATQSRVRAERVAAIMNADIWPITETAASNHTGVYLSRKLEDAS